MIFKSATIQEVMKTVEKVAPAPVPVLILGESGTGKGLVARAIHDLSLRKNHPFVAMNCAALNENLLESELFGHVKGAFTGADRTRKGRFEMAVGGTIFLDEIGEMPLACQPKLLRILQDKEFERVGGESVIKANARVVAATNRDLEKEVAMGRFREDLFYRLNVVRLSLPRLRDRREDIPLLVNHFIAKYSLEYQRPVQAISNRCLKALCRYDYPGNVRELENYIQRAIIVGSGKAIRMRDLPEKLWKYRTWIPKNETRSRGRISALKKIFECGCSGLKNGVKRPWNKTFRCIETDDLAGFLADQGIQWFSRKTFADFLKRQNESDTDKYKTAGVYLKILLENGICDHNGKKANRSRYRVVKQFMAGQSNH